MIHLTFKPFFKCQKSCMYCLNKFKYILKFHFFLITFFQKYFSILWIFSNCSCFPLIISSWRVNLIQMWSWLIKTCKQYWYSKRPYSSWLCILMYCLSCLSTYCLHTNFFSILHCIFLSKFSWLLHQNSKIRTKSCIHSPKLTCH